MLQSDYHGDGTAYFALGRYDPTAETFTGIKPEATALDYSGNFRFFEIGYRGGSSSGSSSGSDGTTNKRVPAKRTEVSSSG
jgi:hypothetical protein